MNAVELIAELKKQHQQLNKDLTLALAYTDKEIEKDGKNIFKELEKFKKDLTEHLNLENGTFYPSYLEKKSARGEDLESTKKFIKEMEDIGKVVIAFLEKYNSPEKISSSLENFKKELEQIIRTLRMRIETEEEGVFDLYLIM